jgi:hypothetical protein
MNRRGLIALRGWYSEDRMQARVLKAARRRRDKGRQARGFAYLGGAVPDTAPEKGLIPLAFGALAGDALALDGPGWLEVGEAVAACLDEQGIPYAWDRTPGAPILLRPDPSVYGLPDHAPQAPPAGRPKGRRTRYAGVYDYPAEGNPALLKNLAEERRLGITPPNLQGPL